MSSSEFSKPEFIKPRMFTLNQIKDLVYLHLSRSELKRKIVRHENMVKYHDDTLFEQGRTQKKMKTDTDAEFADVKSKIVEVNGKYYNPSEYLFNFLIINYRCYRYNYSRL